MNEQLLADEDRRTLHRLPGSIGTPRGLCHLHVLPVLLGSTLASKLVINKKCTLVVALEATTLSDYRTQAKFSNRLQRIEKGVRMTHTNFLRPLQSLFFTSLILVGALNQASAAFIVFESAGANPAAITPTRDAFRTAVGGGTVAGANGDFGGLRREINWDGVPDASSDPNLFPGNFFAARGSIFTTPGSGFLVSSNSSSSTPILFGFPGDLQTFSSQRLFAVLNSNIMDINFVVPGTNTPATTSAFGLVFIDAEDNVSTRVDFYDASNNLLFGRNALNAGNQGLSFLGAVANAGEKIARVRITSGGNNLISNGVRANEIADFVVMDDFLFATPTASAVVPEPSSLATIATGILAIALSRRTRRR